MKAQEFLDKYNKLVDSIIEYKEALDDLINDINFAGYLKENWTKDEVKQVLTCINNNNLFVKSSHDWHAIRFATDVLSNYKRHMDIENHLKFYELVSIEPKRISNESEYIQVDHPLTGYVWSYEHKNKVLAVSGEKFYFSLENITDIEVAFNNLNKMIDYHNSLSIAG